MNKKPLLPFGSEGFFLLMDFICLEPLESDKNVYLVAFNTPKIWSLQACMAAVVMIANHD